MLFTSYFNNLLVSQSDVTSTTLDDQEISDIPDLFSDDAVGDAALLQLVDAYSGAVRVIADNPLLLPPNNSITEINHSIGELRLQLETLTALLQPQIITIYNFHNLKVNTAVTTVKDKVNSLFFDANIPYNWKIMVTWIDKPHQSNTNDVESVTVTMINHHVKSKTIELLNNYFSKVYDNTIYINNP